MSPKAKPTTHGGARKGSGAKPGPRTDRQSAIMARVSPTARAVWDSWPARERSARLSALLEREAPPTPKRADELRLDAEHADDMATFHRLRGSDRAIVAGFERDRDEALAALGRTPDERSTEDLRARLADCEEAVPRAWQVASEVNGAEHNARRWEKERDYLRRVFAGREGAG